MCYREKHTEQVDRWVQDDGEGAAVLSGVLEDFGEKETCGQTPEAGKERACSSEEEERTASAKVLRCKRAWRHREEAGVAGTA